MMRLTLTPMMVAIKTVETPIMVRRSEYSTTLCPASSVINALIRSKVIWYLRLICCERLNDTLSSPLAVRNASYAPILRHDKV